MAGTQKRHAAAFKAKIAIEAAKQNKTLAELAQAYGVHPVQISQWKKQLVDGAESLFRDGRRRDQDDARSSATLEPAHDADHGLVDLVADDHRDARVVDAVTFDDVALGAAAKLGGDAGL